MQVEMDMKNCKTKSVNRCRILELPFLVIYSILSKLTVETIFSCKCVCKTFRQILTDPYFAKLHFIEASKVDDGQIIQDQKYMSSFFLVYNNRPALEKRGSYHDYLPCQKLIMPASISQLYNLVSFVGSCNGMLCLYCTNEKSRRSIFYICNPILGEFSALPPPVKSNPYLDHCGFGFCPKTKQYKVIGFINYSICLVYTLGTSSWRKIRRNVPFPRNSLVIDGCSLNGNLHWITEFTTEISNYICSFNLESEQFSYISPPAQFDRNAHNYLNYSEIGLLDGLLCFSYLLGVRYEAFVMKDYAAKDRCWTKELTIDLSTIPILRDTMYRVVDFLNNGDLYLFTNHDRFNIIAYNLRNGTIRLKLVKNGYLCNVKSFVPSFISLNDISAAAGGHVEVVERKMERNLWSHKCPRFICYYLHL